MFIPLHIFVAMGALRLIIFVRPSGFRFIPIFGVDSAVTDFGTGATGPLVLISGQAVGRIGCGFYRGARCLSGECFFFFLNIW
jgi:hypothetical protein